MFSIDSSAFRKWLSAAGSKLRAETTTALKQSAQAAALFARVSRLYRSHTYGLQKSITGRLVGPDHAQTSATAKYATFVENGTRDHDIRKNKAAGKPLAFMWKGQLMFRQWVHHPGTKPRPFMQEARDKAEPLFDRLCREAVDKAFS